MKRVGVVAVSVLALAMSVVALAFAAQEKDQTTGEDRWAGSVVRINDKTSTVTVRKGHIEKAIHYDASTKWTKGTEAADRSQFTVGSRVICLGKYDDKKEFVADRIDLRQPHMVPTP